MNEQIKVQNILSKKLLEFQAVNPSFTRRALALKLGVQPSALNQILKGSRRVSLKMAQRFADKLMLDPADRSYLFSIFPQALQRDTAMRKSRTHYMEEVKLRADRFEFVSDWIHFAIYSLMDLPDFMLDPKWIAERLNVKESKVQTALERMRGLGLLEAGENGTLKKTYSTFHSTDDQVNVSIQKAHIQDMDMAKEKILNVPVKERDFTSITFVMNPNKMDVAKELIRKFQDEFEAVMLENDPQEVYKLNMYLYPLSHSNQQGERK